MLRPPKPEFSCQSKTRGLRLERTGTLTSPDPNTPVPYQVSPLLLVIWLKRHNFHCKMNFASHCLENHELTFPSFVGGCHIVHYCLQCPLFIPLCFRWKLWKRHTSGGCWMRLRSPPSWSCTSNNRPMNRPVSTTKKFLPTWEFPLPYF